MYCRPSAEQPSRSSHFCGLRPGEARAVRWEDYDTDKGILRVSRSMWRTHLNDPKTEQSVAPVPVAQALADILDKAPRTGEFILPDHPGKPVYLHNLASRVVVPALERCAVCHEMKSKHGKATHEFALGRSLPWRGWYACRRGCATLATSLDSALAAKSLLGMPTSRRRRAITSRAFRPKRSARWTKLTHCLIMRIVLIGRTRALGNAELLAV